MIGLVLIEILCCCNRYFYLIILVGLFSVFKNVLFFIICDYLIVLWELLDFDGGVLLLYYFVKFIDKGRWDDIVFVGVKINRFIFMRREGVKLRMEYIVIV